MQDPFFYINKTDYTANAGNYYDHLAKFQELAKYLSQRVWEYDKELVKRFEQWDLNLQEFPDEVLALLQQWLADGTLAGIINEVIFAQLNADIQAARDRLKLLDGIGTEKVYLYVDGVNGNDTTATGAIGLPFKTIQACLDSIPKVINQDRFVMITPDTYDENARIKSVSGSAVYLQCTDPTKYYKVKSLVFFDINGLTRVENAEFTGSDELYNLRFSRCNYGTSNSNKFVQSKLGTDKVAIEFDGTQGSVNSCTFDSQYTCIFAQNGSRVRVDSTNIHVGTASLRAVSIFSAHVYFNEEVAWIDQTTNPITVSRGGRYTWDRSYIVLTPQNGWTHVADTQTDTYQARAFKDDSNMIHLFGAITGGTVGNVNAIQLPVGYRPVFNTHVFPAYVDDNTIAKVAIDRTGQLQVQKGNNLTYVSLSGISFYAGR